MIGSSASAPAPKPVSGGPPPPAPTAAQLEALSRAQESKPAPASAANVLGELSKGTGGLRKVDKSEMTHKNPELRATSVVPAATEKGMI
jgi:adenylyl cyclase-associated protein